MQKGSFIVNNKFFYAFNTIASAILFIFSFPGYNLDFLIFFSLVPVFFVFTRSSEKKFKKGFIFGIIVSTLSLIWLAPTISDFGGLPLISAIAAITLLGTYLGIYKGFFAFLFPENIKNQISSLFIIPAIWTGLDYLTSVIFTGFPWVFPGYALINRLEIIQISSITGVYGLTFFVVFINTGIFLILNNILQKKKFEVLANFKIVLLMVIFSAGLFSFGTLNLKKTNNLINNADNAKIMLLQANIPPENKHEPESLMKIFNKFLKMSQSTNNNYHLAVWPETALPYPVFWNEDMTEILNHHAEKNGNQLVGTLDIKRDENLKFIMKNRAALFLKSDQNKKDSYDKIHLVPFGEYIPLKKQFPFLEKFIVPAGEFTPGEENRIIEIDKMKIAVKICFEIIFPDLVRRQINKGGNIIINMTNDAWFGKSSGPYQHLAIARFRAVENRRSIARCANTGISAHILPTGEIKSFAGISQKKALVKSLPLIHEKTFYTTHGDFFAYFCLVMLLLKGFFHYRNHGNKIIKGD